jgi:hypothetical protein
MQAVPPKISLRRKSFIPGVMVPLVFLALIIGGTVFFFDPATHRFFPGCTFHKLTGWNCPGCGATRSLHALLHGDLPAALRDNALFIAAILFFGGRGAWFAANHFRGHAPGNFFQPRLLWPWLPLALVFSVLRNLPAFAFLAP